MREPAAQVESSNRSLRVWICLLTLSLPLAWCGPAGAVPTADTYLPRHDGYTDQADPAGVFARENRLYLRGGASGKTREAFLKFRVVETGHEVLSASLELTAGSTDDQPLQVRVELVERFAFSESNLSWNRVQQAAPATLRDYGLVEVSHLETVSIPVGATETLPGVDGEGLWFFRISTSEDQPLRWVFSREQSEERSPKLVMESDDGTPDFSGELHQAMTAALRWDLEGLDSILTDVSAQYPPVQETREWAILRANYLARFHDSESWRFAEARQVLNGALRGDALDAPVHGWLTLFRFWEHQWELAVEEAVTCRARAQELIAQQPQSGEGYLWRGICEHFQSEADQSPQLAIDNLSAALTYGARGEMAYWWLSLYWALLDNEEQAFIEIQNALELDPQFVEGHWWRFRLGDVFDDNNVVCEEANYTLGLAPAHWDGALMREVLKACSIGDPCDCEGIQCGQPNICGNICVRGSGCYDILITLRPVSAAFPNLPDGLSVTVQLDGSDGSSQQLTLTGSASAAFPSPVPADITAELSVIADPAPSAEYGTITCTVPPQVSILDHEIQVVGSCTNQPQGVDWSLLCEQLPELCRALGEGSVPGSCVLAAPETGSQCTRSSTCDTWEDLSGDLQERCLAELGQCLFSEGRLDCNEPAVLAVTTTPQPRSYDGPLLTLRQPDADVAQAAGDVLVEGHLFDLENDFRALAFFVDGVRVEPRHLRTGIEDPELCAVWQVDERTCDPISVFRGYIPVDELAPGSHTLTVAAMGGEPARGLSLVSRSFVLDPPACSTDQTNPTVNILSPDPQVVEGQHPFTAEAADDSGLTSLTLLLDGVEVAQAPSSPLSHTWNATARSTPYTLRAEALDGCGNTAYQEIAVTVTATAEPSFALWSGSNQISEGDILGYGPVEEGTVKTNTFTIANDGAADLVFPASAFSLSSSHWAFYSPLPASVAAGGSVDVSIGTTGTAPVGTSQATVTILLPSSFAESDFTFDVVAGIEAVNTCASDTTPPTVTLAQPASPTVGQPVTLTATSTSTDVAGVRFKADGVQIGLEDTTSPYSVSWTPQSEGSHDLTAEATDQCGLSSSHTITVSVAPGGSCGTDTAAPTLTMTRPSSAGDTAPVGNAYRLEAFVGADESAISSVDFLVQAPGSTYQTVGSASSPAAGSTAIYNGWTPTTAGTYSIKAKVTDACGHSREAAAVSLTAESDPCAGDTAGPASVSLTAPVAYDDFRTGETVSMTASASSDTETVEFYAGTTLLTTDTAAPWSGSHSFSATGNYSLVARAYDGCGNSTDSAAVPIYVDETCDVADIFNIVPAQGASVEATSSVTLSASAQSDEGIENVVFLIDGTEVGRRVFLDPPQSPSASVTWDASSAALTSHTLTVNSRAVGCDVGTASVTFALVEPDPCLSDTAGPTVDITYPTAFDVYEPGNITIQSTASDPNGVDRVVTSANGSQLCDDGADDQPSYSCAWNATIGDDQPVTVVAYDHCGNPGSAQVPVDIQFTPDSPTE